MDIINALWAMIVLFIAITIIKIWMPTTSYILKLSLVVAVIGAVYFAFFFIASLSTEENSTVCFMFMCAWIFYIYKGGKSVALNTMSGVFSRINKQAVGTMKAGSLRWADPVFEVVTISVDGIPNKSADLQRFEMSMSETAMIQTKTRGVQAKVKTISMMLELAPNGIQDILIIEGGLETIKGRVHHFIDEFFLEEIPTLTPAALDRNKAKTIEHLREGLEGFVNHHCHENHYPYHVVHGSVIIADTELEAEYYKTLGKTAYARLENQAKNVDSVALKKRIADMGQKLLPSGTEKEQLEAALIALSIVKKDISTRTYNLDSETREMAKEIALALFKK